jgi:hypothetical protein
MASRRLMKVNNTMKEHHGGALMLSPTNNTVRCLHD